MVFKKTSHAQFLTVLMKGMFKFQIVMQVVQNHIITSLNLQYGDDYEVTFLHIAVTQLHSLLLKPLVYSTSNKLIEISHMLNLEEPQI